MEKMNFESKDIKTENIKKIEEIFPSCITEIKDKDGNLSKAIDFEALKQILSGNLAEGIERYEFTWPGKNESILEANRPIKKTLRPCKEESKNWDITENLYIEGDNLDALKLLQESYLGKVKMIYIDPPYNTGSDFIYEDDFKEYRDEYVEDTDQVDEYGNRFFKNTETNGRFHSDWCSMIYPRLMLARNLLSEDGVIFISIDDNEQANLKKVCDEIFGASNFIGTWNWFKSATPANLSKKIKKNIEYILCYEKNKNNSKYKGLKKSSKSNNGLLNQTNSINRLTFPKNVIETNLEDGLYKKGLYKTKKYDITLLEDAIVRDNKFITDVILIGKFKWSQDYLLDQIKNGTKISIKSKAFSPSYEKKEYDPEVPPNLIDKRENVQTTEYAGSSLDELFSISGVFDYPKPTSLLKYLVGFISTGDEIVLDFFSGSGTTAHAVMQLNAEDGGDRKFIMVQLPEETDEESETYKAGYKNICEIGKERIRRAGDKILEDNKDKDGIQNLDVGFRVFKVDSTNMKDVYYKPDEYNQGFLDEMVSNIKEDRSDLDLLFACLLEWGLPLTKSYELEEIHGKKIHNYDKGALVACFEDNIDEEIVKEIAKKEAEIVVFRDSSFKTSADKINVEEIFKELSPDTSIKIM
ncbi:site-specific DNA-methyltransferase [Peptoniphilus genitalis]|uniref:Site-specific DNA-methyltransferase n=1 Tax=Peptoniphilus genitalis TaxID=3036303 RepID=A0ABY4TNU7_9FIRM|nr:site-specific DNA-methyltransferase [Peptoniphilus sp. SAHP1]URN41622.1 site-specific DNA-methyltransferase [Peptoniphilus sp. SAHP1]